jgi:hypothetical protein
LKCDIDSKATIVENQDSKVTALTPAEKIKTKICEEGAFNDYVRGPRTRLGERRALAWHHPYLKIISLCFGLHLCLVKASFSPALAFTVTNITPIKMQ